MVYQWHLNELVYHLLLIPYCLFGHENSPFCFIQTHPKKGATGRLLFRKSRRNIFDHNGQGPDEKPRGWFCWVILWESDGICRAFTGSFAQALSIWSRTWNLFCLICLGSWLAFVFVVVLAIPVALVVVIRCLVASKYAGPVESPMQKTCGCQPRQPSACGRKLRKKHIQPSADITPTISYINHQQICEKLIVTCCYISVKSPRFRLVKSPWFRPIWIFSIVPVKWEKPSSWFHQLLYHCMLANPHSAFFIPIMCGFFPLACQSYSHVWLYPDQRLWYTTVAAKLSFRKHCNSEPLSERKQASKQKKPIHGLPYTPNRSGCWVKPNLYSYHDISMVENNPPSI